MLLDVYGTGLEGACCRLCVELLLICPPFATHEVETTEAQYDRLFEVGEEHTHETYGGEVADGAYLLAVGGIERNTELIPFHLLLVAVAQWGKRFAYL